MSKDILSKVKPRDSKHNTNEWVYNSLCQLILTGEFVPGISFTFRGIARLNLEPQLSVLALKHIDSKRLKLLINIDKNLDYAISTGNIEDYIKYNYQFHFGIYEAGLSPVLLPLVRTLWLRFSPFYRIVAGRAGTQTLKDFHHSAIDAIIAKDSVALEVAIHSDILEGMEMLNESLNE